VYLSLLFYEISTNFYQMCDFSSNILELFIILFVYLNIQILESEFIDEIDVGELESDQIVEDRLPRCR